MPHSVLSLSVCDAGKKAGQTAKPGWAAAIEQAVSPCSVIALGILFGRHGGDRSKLGRKESMSVEKIGCWVDRLGNESSEGVRAQHLPGI